MEIHFKNNKDKKFWGSEKALRKKHGAENAKIITRRLNELSAAPTLKELPPQSSPHPLSGNMNGLFALDLKHPYRLIIEPVKKLNTKNPIEIDSIQIIKIKNYH